MHFLFIAQQWWPETGVPQRRMNWFVAGLRQRGHTVSVVTSPPHFPDGKLLSADPDHQAGAVTPGPNGETIYRTRFLEYTNTIPSRLIDQGAQMLAALPVVRRAIADKRPDLIVATAPPIPPVMNALAAHNKYDIPFVVDLRDAWPDNDRYIAETDRSLPSPTLTRRVGAKVLRAFGPFYTKAIEASDGVFTTTFSHAWELNFRWGLRTLVVRNLAGVDLESKPLPPRVTEEDNPVLEALYMGNIGRAQGLYTLLQTMEILAERKVPVHVRLQGRGAHAGFIRRQAEERGLNIEVHGRVPAEKVQAFYANSDTLLVPLETWPSLQMTVPSKLFETMLTGRHITCIAEGETRDIVMRSHAGDVVPPGDPKALADLWTALQKDRSRLAVAGNGTRWLRANTCPDQELEDALDFLEASAL